MPGMDLSLRRRWLAIADGFIVSLGGQSRFGRWLFEDE
jgi:hypothetical protein